MNNLILQHHWAGFYSCCFMRLVNIIDFCIENNEEPQTIINNKCFTWYNPNIDKDIVPDFFKTNEKISLSYDIKINWCYSSAQFMNYIDLPLTDLYPYVEKFFSPTDKILAIKENIIEKYSIDINNSCVLFLRGNNKATECKIPEYNEYIINANTHLKNNPDIEFIIQSDEIEFIDEMKSKFPNNIVFYDEIRTIKKNDKMTVDNNGETPEINYDYALNFLAIVLIMSECKYIICNSGNISLWTALFRKNLENFTQL